MPVHFLTEISFYSPFFLGCDLEVGKQGGYNDDDYNKEAANLSYYHAD